MHSEAKIRQGFAESRVRDEKTGEHVVKRAPFLGLKQIINHIDSVTRFVAMGEALHEFDAITRDAGLRGAMVDKFGQQHYDTIRKWLHRQAGNIRNSAFTWIQMNDRATAAAVWLASYNMGLDGHGDFDTAGMTKEQVEARAIQYADMITASQTSTFNADLALMQSDSSYLWKFFTMFISANIRRFGRMHQYADAWRAGQVGTGQFASTMAKENLLPAIGLVMFKAMWQSAFGPPDDRDKDEWLRGLFADVAGETLGNVTGAIPGLNVLNSPGHGGPRVAIVDYPYTIADNAKKGAANA